MMLDPLLRDAEAETLRRSHCDRKGREHECMGVISIDKQGVSLNCKLCGSGFESLEGISSLVDEAKAFCDIFGVEYLQLPTQQRQRLLLQVLSLMQSHG